MGVYLRQSTSVKKEKMRWEVTMNIIEQSIQVINKNNEIE